MTYLVAFGHLNLNLIISCCTTTVVLVSYFEIMIDKAIFIHRNTSNRNETTNFYTYRPIA